MYSEEYIISVRARAIVALHTRRLHPEFIEIAERDIATMSLEPRGYRCDQCNHISCGNCGRCHMIDAAPDEKICTASKNRRAGCAEWRQAYNEIQYILEADQEQG